LVVYPRNCDGSDIGAGREIDLENAAADGWLKNENPNAFRVRDEEKA